MRADTVQRTLASITSAMDRASSAEHGASSAGLLQSVDPRVKLAGILGLICAVAFSRNLATIVALLGAAIVLSILSRVSASAIARLWIIVLAFTLVMVLPALFTTRGHVVGSLFGLDITLQGLRTAAFLVGRVLASTTFALLLVTTSPWPHIIAALRRLGTPSSIVLLLAMTYRYVFVLLRSAEEMFVACRARTIGPMSSAVTRRMMTANAGVLLGRTIDLSEEIYLAMRSRGFDGEVRLVDEFVMRSRDWVAAGAFFTAVVAGLWAGWR